MNTNEKILVTGSTGMLGKAVTTALHNSGHTNLLTPSSSALNLRDRNQVLTYIKENKPDHIFHLASVVYGLKGNQSNQMQSLIENTKIYTHLLEACAEVHQPKKIFFAGTVASYAFPFKKYPLDETDFFSGLPHFGEFGYAMAKRHAYPYLELLKEKMGVDYVYGLYTNLYGPNDRFDVVNGHVVPSLISKAVLAHELGNKHFVVWGNPNSSRDFMYIEDAANATVLLMKNGSGIINICSGTTTSMHDLAWTISKCLDNSVEPIWDANEPTGIQNREISAKKLRALDFANKFKIEDGLQKTISWYKNSNEVRV